MEEEQNKMVDLHAAIRDKLRLPELAEMQVTIDVLRLDRIHPVISGNKWFKLKYYLHDALSKSHRRLLTFGGAYSNHVLAVACAAGMSGLSSIAVIRGEESKTLSHTLLAARQYGMQLHFVSREAYRAKESGEFLEEIAELFGECYIIPEGGKGQLGKEGSKEILQLVNPSDYTHIICAIGTGTTFTGITEASVNNQQMIGIPVMKGIDESSEMLKLQLLSEKHYVICNDFHFGGYAKRNKQLIEFMNRFYLQTGIPTDFVYTGKMFYALTRLLQQGYFPAGSKVLAIHSGGLQGNQSLPAGTLLF